MLCTDFWPLVPAGFTFGLYASYFSLIGLSHFFWAHRNFLDGLDEKVAYIWLKVTELRSYSVSYSLTAQYNIKG